jgi:hypothetical protein
MGLLIKLQDGDTALKSLKFGNDRPGGGDSNQPYIKNPIDRPNTPTLNSDFLLRGGISTPLNAAEDVARLTKYFFDYRNPSGLLFTAKQNLLSRTAVKTEASYGAAYNGGGVNEGIYTPLSTLAQAGVVAFGGHLNKQGLDPTGTFTGAIADPNIVKLKQGGLNVSELSEGTVLAINRYQDVAYNNNREDKNYESPNAPLFRSYESVYNTYLDNPTTPTYILDRKPITGENSLYTNRLLKLRDVTGLNLTSPTEYGNTLYSYKGGPNSIVGFGTTDIKFATGNDGQVALRTNNLRNLIGMYGEEGRLKRPNPYFQTNIIFGNLYSSKPGVSRLYESTFKSSPYYSSTNIFEGGNYENYVKNNSGDSSFQPWIQSFVTPSGSNIPLSKTYQTSNPHQPETGLFVTPTGSSSEYKKYTGKTILTGLINPSGSDSFQLDYDASVYKSGTLEPRTDVDLTTYLTRKDLNVNAKTRNSKEAKYNSPINKKLDASGRELITDPVYDPSTGTFYSTDTNGNILGKFDPALMNKMLEKTTSETWNYTGSKSHGNGYLANLDKNAGYYIDQNSGKLQFVINQYTRGIAPDFRVTDRATRGFNDYTSSKSNGYTYGGYDVVTKDASNYGGQILDKIYYSSTDKRQSKSLLVDKDDLIDFSFRIVDPTKPSSPVVLLDFRAYIDQFSDSYSNDWKAQTYMGRAEKQYKYNSFDRSISLGFTVAAENKDHLDEMYSQLNVLASTIAPKYTSQGYMAGVLHQLRVGNYIWDQWGILQGLTYEVSEESPWEIDQPRQLPYYIKVTGVKFIPIHVFRPQAILESGESLLPGSINSMAQRYIYQTDGGKPN